MTRIGLMQFPFATLGQRGGRDRRRVEDGDSLGCGWCDQHDGDVCRCTGRDRCGVLPYTAGTRGDDGSKAVKPKDPDEKALSSS